MNKMKRNFLRVSAFLAVFALLALVPSAGAEPVKINGKTLDNVQDIMTETTGTRVFRKNSLATIKWYRPNNASDTGSDLRSYYYNFDDGVVTPHQQGPITVRNAPPTDSEWSSGMHPAVSSKPLSDGLSYRAILPDFSHHGHDTWYYTYTMRADSDGTIHADVPRQLPTGIPAGNIYPTDAASGLFVGGENDESFVVARMAVHEGGSTHLGDKETQYDCYLEFLDGKLLNGSGAANPTAASYYTGFGVGMCPVIRVVAGDFDNDGAASEVAYIRSSAYDHYYLEIMKVSRNSSGSFSVSSLFAQDVGHRDKNGGNIEGCDVVAGDFNGDGKQEVAAVFNDLVGSDGHAVVQVFYWNGSGFSTKYTAVRDNNHRLGGTNASAYTAFYGLIADAGDLNGDGRDEIVYTAPLYGDIIKGGRLILSVWDADDSFNLSEKYMTLTPYALAWTGSLVGSKIDIYNFLLRSVSLTLAPVGNVGEKAPRDDVLLSIAEGYDAFHSANYIQGDRLYLFRSTVSPDGTFIGFDSTSGAKLASGSTGGWAMGLMTADFAAESLVLDAPTHTVVRDKKTYAATVQTPPYHVDYAPVPWASDPTQPALTNFSYAGGSVAYSKSGTESTVKDTLFEARQFAERGADIGASGGLSSKKLAGFSIGGKASAGWKKSTSSSLSEANKSSTSVSMSLSSATDTSDNLMFYKADFHIWRYPILGQAPAELFGTPAGGTIAGTPDGTQYFTYTMSDEPTRVQGDAGQSSQFDDYNPIHEEGNLFSYPTTIEATPGYAQKQSDLSIEDQKTLGGTFTEDLVFSSQVTDIDSLKTTAKTQFNGSLSLSMGIPKLLEGSLSASAMHGNEIGDSSTFTKSYQSSEKFHVNLPSPTLGFNFDYAAYLLKMRAFSDAAGVMSMAFAVDLADNPNAWLWRAGNGSIYSEKPDPALVLPARYNRVKDISTGSELIRWVANTDAQSATQIRGIWFYDKDRQEYATASLTRGGNYTISFPVYNASFLDAGAVAIEVGYADASGARQLIGRYTATLGGWHQKTENNKAMVNVDWTVPADMPEGRYDLYFSVDPDNLIDEVHEDWNATVGDPGYDPSGNNTGRYPFAVTASSSSSVLSAARSALAAQDGSFTMTIDGMSLADFRSSLAGRTEDFRAHGTVAFRGDEPLKNVYVEVVVADAGEEKSQRLVANRHIPAIFPGESEKFSFMVSPLKLRNERITVSLNADNSSFSTELDSVSPGPVNPAPDSNSGGGCDAGIFGGGVGTLIFVAVLKKRRR